MRRRIDSAESERLALAIGTPASILKELFCEALINAGVTDRPTLLVEENRRVSLGLALNWGLRLLIAYALEMSPTRSRTSQVHDLRWLRSSSLADIAEKSVGSKRVTPKRSVPLMLAHCSARGVI
jgi:hypothetical protein